MFSTTGIRGISNKDITPELAVKLGKTFGTFLGDGCKIIVARDTRTSSEMLRDALVSGLLSTGADVTDAGVLPVPALGYATGKHFDGGVMITSSHNPPQYNGFKFILENGLEITSEAENRFEEIFNSTGFRQADWDKLGTLSSKNFVDEYISAVIGEIDAGATKKSGLRIVMDTGNGAQSTLAPKLTEALGCKTTALHTELKGEFDRPPEPKAGNIDALQKTVVDESAALGVAFDIDGDRAIFVDELGEVLMGDVTGTLIARELFKENGGKTITTVSTSKITDDVMESVGGELIKTRVGGKYVADAMLKQGGAFGFEEGGGCIFNPFNLTRDADMAMAKIIEIIAKSGKQLSEVISEMPRYYQLKTKVDCPDDKKEEVIGKLGTEFSDAGEVITVDGVKAIYDNGSILIRASGTEPIIRIFAEATTEERAKELQELGINKLKSFV